MRGRVVVVGVAAMVGALACTVVGAHAQAGVQWSRDGKRLLVNKDVGNERWAMTYNIDDGSVTGNVFVTGGANPAFITCEKVRDDGGADLFALEVTLRCHGAERVVSGPFALDDWGLIRETTLPFGFFLPQPETCQFYAAANGPNAAAATSFWDCDGDLELQIFADGTGVSSELGALSIAQTGCASAIVNAGGDVGSATVLLSTGGQTMNLFQRGLGADALHECRRVPLP